MEKLVRDRIPDLIAARGEIPNVRHADDDEMPYLLKTKLLEEAQEVAATDNNEALLDELADVIEVTVALARRAGSDLDHVLDRRARKHARRGGFDAQIVLTLDD